MKLQRHTFTAQHVKCDCCEGILLCALLPLTCIGFGLVYAICIYQKIKTMNKNEFRQFAALALLSALVNTVANPAELAVFWADELIKELEKQDDGN